MSVRSDDATASPAADHHLAVPGADLAYDVRGSGPIVIQAHGMSSSRTQDLELGLDFSGLAGDHTLVRYDARGHGASTGRPDPADCVWPNLAHDFLTLRGELAGAAPVDGIGASMGTATLLHAVVQEPSVFHRLVLVIPPTAWATRAGQGDVYRQGADLIERDGLAPFVAALQTQTPPALAEVPDLAMQPQVSERLFPSVLRGAGRSDLPSAEALAVVTQPVLLLPWADDPVHPVETAERLAEFLPAATLVEPATSLADVRDWRRRVAEFLA